jgi:hypothetical protein
MIYFIQDDHNRVKIGYSRNPRARLDGLQTGHADKLRLVRSIEGTEATERFLHTQFAHLRLQGEWFTFCQEMLEVEIEEELETNQDPVDMPRFQLDPNSFPPAADILNDCIDRIIASYYHENVQFNVDRIRDSLLSEIDRFHSIARSKIEELFQQKINLFIDKEIIRRAALIDKRIKDDRIIKELPWEDAPDDGHDEKEQRAMTKWGIDEYKKRYRYAELFFDLDEYPFKHTGLRPICSFKRSGAEFLCIGEIA